MKESFGGGEFLKKKYDLHNAPEVAEQADIAEARTGAEVPQDPSSRIQNYLSRFEGVLDRKDPEDRERGVEALKRLLHRKFVTRPEDVSESYFELQKKIAREQGRGDIEVTPEMREQLTEAVVADQESSLDVWVDYLSGPDATYPTWLKYWATREVAKMAEYDKAKKEFTKRSNGTTKPFPDLNREALAVVLDAVEKKYDKKAIDLTAYEADDKAAFEKLLQGESFPKLYAWAIEKCTPATKEQLENVEGEWKTYKQGSDHMPLVESLQGHGTGWCTAGESTARHQLDGGDFHVFYSMDKVGVPTVPRVAIRMQEDKIAEVRGVAEQQNLDPYVGDVVQAKMAEFPDGKEYEKKAGDMKRLTLIEKKMQANQPLDARDLRLLYELDGPIQGFGYGRDPRVKELRYKRNPKEDAPILFECKPEQVAWNKEDITDSTMAYVGELFPGVFDRFLPHLYTSFPEGRVERRAVEIGGKTAKEYEKELDKEGFKIYDYAKDLLGKMPVSKKRHEMETVRLTVARLGFKKVARYDEICKRAKELGLDLAPAEVGPALRLSMKEQAMNDWVRVAMEPLTVRSGNSWVFCVARGGDGSCLRTDYGERDDRWDPDDSFAFSVRKQHLDT